MAIGGIQNQGIQQNPNIQNQGGNAFVEGLKSIGKAICQFGASIADFFKSLGGGTANAPANHQVVNQHPSGSTAKVLQGSTFTEVEKQNHMEQALNSQFFKDLENSTDGYINQTTFRSVAEAILNTPMNVAGMKEYGVTLDEVVAISMYTSNAFNEVNDALRNGVQDPAMQGLATAFTNGLAKLPSFDGNPVQTPQGTRYECYRGAKLPQNIGNLHQIGNQVNDPGIMSSSYDKSEEFSGCNYSMTLLLKPGSEGKDISMFSDKPTECEVAFPPGVQFQVTARHLDTGGMLPPHMEATYHPGFNGSIPMGTVKLVMMEV